VPEIVVALDALDDYLAFHTFLTGHAISAADWALWGSIKGWVIHLISDIELH